MTNISSYSYLVAAIAFGLLGAFLLTVWRRRVHGLLLATACLLSMAWSAVLAWESGRLGTVSVLANCLEVLRNGAWSAFLLVLAGNVSDERSSLPFGVRPKLALLGGAYIGFLLLTATGVAGAIPLSGIALAAGAHVGMAVLGMLLVEQQHRNKPEQQRWAIKFASLGIGTMFAYDFYMFCDAMLFHAINYDIWAARGAINALSVPLIAISVSRSALWSSGLAVSRRVMYHSVTLFGSALYLLAMGSAGYYLRYFGGSWGTLMQVTFLFGALLLLFGILFSGTFRAWLKVFISKHFYSYNYDYREEWLRFTGTLSQHGPGLGARTIEAVGALVESQGGLLWIRRESGAFEAAAAWQMAPAAQREAADSPFCRFLESTQWVVDLEELARDPAKYHHVEVPAWLRQLSRAWLVIPLMTQGRLFGFMLLLQPRSAIALNWEVIDLLKIAGNQAASYLAQEDAANALMVNRQFESFNRMSTFVVHDLKNLVAQLSLMMSNAERHKDNPEFQRDMIDTVNYSVQKMKLLLQKLSRGVAPERMAAVPVAQLLKQAVALKAGFDPTPVLRAEQPGLVVLADWERLERVVGHLIQNAIEATAPDGTVDIVSQLQDGMVAIRISDSGEGMSEQFVRERLFKPFETTKSAGMGIGMFESKEYIEELGGVLAVASTVNSGTTVTIRLPLYRQDVPSHPTQHQAA